MNKTDRRSVTRVGQTFLWFDVHGVARSGIVRLAVRSQRSLLVVTPDAVHRPFHPCPCARSGTVWMCDGFRHTPCEVNLPPVGVHQDGIPSSSVL
jgi:hypothetical protein